MILPAGPLWGIYQSSCLCGLYLVYQIHFDGALGKESVENLSGLLRHLIGDRFIGEQLCELG